MNFVALARVGAGCVSNLSSNAIRRQSRNVQLLNMQRLQRGRAPGGAELHRSASTHDDQPGQLQRGRAPGGAELI